MRSQKGMGGEETETREQEVARRRVPQVQQYRVKRWQGIQIKMSKMSFNSDAHCTWM